MRLKKSPWRLWSPVPRRSWGCLRRIGPPLSRVVGGRWGSIGVPWWTGLSWGPPLITVVAPWGCIPVVGVTWRRGVPRLGGTVWVAVVIVARRRIPVVSRSCVPVVPRIPVVSSRWRPFPRVRIIPLAITPATIIGWAPFFIPRVRASIRVSVCSIPRIWLGTARIPLPFHRTASRLVLPTLGGRLDLVSRESFAHFYRPPTYLKRLVMLKL